MVYLALLKLMVGTDRKLSSQIKKINTLISCYADYLFVVSVVVLLHLLQCVIASITR